MKLTIVRGNLISLVETCVTVAKSKTTMPVLSCVLLRASGGTLIGSSTDLFQEIVTSVVADVVTAGEVVVNAKDLLDRVKSLPDVAITLTLASSKLTMTAGKRKHVVPFRAVEEFPIIALAPTTGFQVAAATLRAMIRKTRYAMADSPERAHLHATLFEREDYKMTAVATNGLQMPRVTAVVPASVAGDKLLVPFMAIETILAVLPKDGDVEMIADGGKMWLRVGATSYCSKLVEGEFPPYRDYMKNVPKGGASVKREELIASLWSVEKGSPEGAKKGLVTLELADGTLRVTASGNGEAQDELEALNDGADILFGVYAKQITDVLSAIDSESVRIHINSDMDPIFIRPDVEDDDELYVVMPAKP